MAKLIPLTHGKFAIVDDDDFEYLNQWKWFYSDGGYAHKNTCVTLKSDRAMIRMHRLINKTPDGSITDHINRDKLDNRKCNLRDSDKSLNSINRDKQSNNTSGYRGVWFDAWSNKWRAELKLNGKKITLGRFMNIDDAIVARTKGELQYYGI